MEAAMLKNSVFILMSIFLFLALSLGGCSPGAGPRSPILAADTPGSGKSKPSPAVTQEPASTLTVELTSTWTPSMTVTPSATPTPAVWQPLPPLPEEERGLCTHGDRSQKWVALTFDCCQKAGDLAGFDQDIVDVLDQNQIPATFFLGGLWMRDHVDATQLLDENPLFEIGNHSWSHRDFPGLTRAEMEEEILKTQELMYELLGYQTRLFRFPSGEYTADALDVVADLGMYAVQWDVVSGDPVGSITPEHLRDWVLQQVEPGSIIIFHANERGWHTAEALPDIIHRLKEDGYRFVKVSDLLEIEKPDR
jgi:peptidoglycan/xylan/chitin deacetylase (PgdA/CDA1 family)